MNDRRESQALIDQELLEINANLVRFLRASDIHSLWSGGSITCALVGIPSLVLLAWLNGADSLLCPALIAISVVAVGFVVSILWNLKRNRSFQAIRVTALKLQRAGYLLYKKEVFLKSVIGATQEPLPDQAEVIDFQNIGGWELDAIMR